MDAENVLVRENLAVGVVSVLTGAATLAFLPEMVSGETLAAIGDPYSPAFFPILIGALLIVCGGVMIAGTAMGRAPVVHGEGRVESPLRIGTTAGFIVVYTLLITWVGMLAASVLCIAGLAYILGYRRHVIIGVAAVVVPVLIYVLFERMLYVLLPQPTLF